MNGCSGHRMLLEHGQNYALGMDALVTVCSWNTNGIMLWAWMLWSPYALGIRAELCFGHSMLLEHGRNYALGMDALVTVCSWNTNGIMLWAWMLWSPYALGTRTEVCFGHGCSGHRMLLNTNGKPINVSLKEVRFAGRKSHPMATTSHPPTNYVCLNGHCKCGRGGVLQNSKQHHNKMLATRNAGQFSKACFARLTWTMAPRDANVDTLSSKISGVQSKLRAKIAVQWITLAGLLKEPRQTL